jgi:hypothetical protein
MCDPTRLNKPEVIGNLRLRGSVRPVVTIGFAVTVAHVTLWDYTPIHNDR